MDNVGAADWRRLTDALSRDTKNGDLLAVETNVTSDRVEAEKAGKRLLLALVVDDLATALSCTNRALTVVVVLRSITRAGSLTLAVDRRGTLSHGGILLLSPSLGEALKQVHVSDGNRDTAQRLTEES